MAFSRDEVLDMLDDDNDDFDEIMCEGSDEEYEDCMDIEEVDECQDDTAVSDCEDDTTVSHCENDTAVSEIPNTCSDDDSCVSSENNTTCDNEEDNTTESIRYNLYKTILNYIYYYYNSPSQIKWSTTLQPIVVRPFTKTMIVLYIFHTSIYSG